MGSSILKRFWRQFKTSFRSHKPESRVCSRRSDGGERVTLYAGKTREDSFFFPCQYFARALRSERLERASIFEGQAAKLQPRLSEEPGEEMIDLLAPVITLKMCPQFCEEGQVFYFAVWRGMIFAIISRLDLTDIVEPFDRNLTRGTTQQSLGSIQVSKLPTHSSSKPTFCPKGEVSFNVILGEG